jgi:hypothetical protein
LLHQYKHKTFTIVVLNLEKWLGTKFVFCKFEGLIWSTLAYLVYGTKHVCCGPNAKLILILESVYFRLIEKVINEMEWNKIGLYPTVYGKYYNMMEYVLLFFSDEKLPISNFLLLLGYYQTWCYTHCFHGNYLLNFSIQIHPHFSLRNKISQTNRDLHCTHTP